MNAFQFSEISGLISLSAHFLLLVVRHLRDVLSTCFKLVSFSYWSNIYLLCSFVQKLLSSNLEEGGCTGVCKLAEVHGKIWNYCNTVYYFYSSFAGFTSNRIGIADIFNFGQNVARR